MFIAFWDRIPVTETQDEYEPGTHIYFSKNQLSIDDDILTYNTRSIEFMNYDPQSLSKFVIPRSISYFENEIKEDYDVLHWFGLNLSQQGKSYTRVRRKFVDDVATRGG